MMDKNKLVYSIMDTLYELSREISEYESIPRQYGTDDEIFMVEAHTINLIGENSNITISEIAKITNRTKGAISQMVEKLINKDIVCKEKDLKDQRRVFLHLTDKGKQIYDYHKKLDEKEYSKIIKKLDHYSYDEFEKFYQIARDMLGIVRGGNKGE
ncbi:MarR family winged helix-turn-helix transcriptional regulator [Ureibacillus acetophenoni]|uniref:DNA-binding MarR family transcriptional regulator n=1 Tax=Ureibacillus acetophenoni TaxID=614649 RepID=A0A285U9M9_9BACL|nr:winged helix DNA-binding protein [Ureibacillus acetophenoni]SOC38519.1 DNA-binding MarR family transcriptional regulator [Ureibacillus acetophenoni]